MTAMTQAVTWTVGQVAREFGVTVRTLHHYDAIGLLTPSDRTRAGYRRYTEPDLIRLRHIVLYRRLDFSLDEVAELLAAPDTVGEHLRRQRDAVTSRLDELAQLVTALDRAIAAEEHGMKLTKEEQRELFGDQFEEYAAEAAERWGDSPLYAQSQKKAAQYTRQDWERIKADGDVVNAAFVDAMRDGSPATSERAMDAAEAHRAHTTRWFYDCSLEIHENLADMYMADERFTAYYDQLAPGLTAYVRAAIHANAARRRR
ncbi:MerR family transcriptional regulator [Pilimelia columellifera]|uniref:MerR family transcriptional regulator n=1 Tax=Pilimelia columellifera subsp. columellifera TaxID=706583 RepID=A0ABN3N4D1_9ACTN